MSARQRVAGEHPAQKHRPGIALGRAAASIPDRRASLLPPAIGGCPVEVLQIR